MRFPVEIVRRARELVGGDFPIIYRISLLDLVENGQTWEEVVELAHLLEDVGVTVLNTGIGWHEARVPTIITQVPRARVGRLHRAAQGRGVGAGLRVQPDQHPRGRRGDPRRPARPTWSRWPGRCWPTPSSSTRPPQGRADEINTCIACNQACLDHVFKNQKASCLVNPRACHETTLVLPPTRVKKSVAVVGAGPAGLATAVSAAERGLAVTLFEKSDELGGQFKLAMQVPGKEDFRDTLRYYRRRLEVLGVDVRLGVEAGDAELASYDDVVLATGVTPRIPAIPGVDHPRVLRYDEVLSGAVVPGRQVAVIGAGGIGVDVSVWLTHDPGETPDEWMAHWGVADPSLHRGGLTEPKPRAPQREVTLIQRKTTPIGIGLGKTSGWAHRAVLKQSEVRLVSGASYDRIEPTATGERLRVHLTVDGESAEVIEVDHVVLCAGQESVRDLVAPGRTVIGGADVAAELDAKRAIKQGTEVAAAL